MAFPYPIIGQFKAYSLFIDAETWPFRIRLSDRFTFAEEKFNHEETKDEKKL